MRKKSWNSGFLWLGIMWGIILLCFCLMSCRTKYVSVPEFHTEYVNKEVHDTLKEYLFQKDSVIFYTKGDTVYRDKFQILYKDRYNVVERTDTMIKTDSIRVPYPVERKLTKWESAKMAIGEITMIVLFIAIVIVIGWFLYKWKIRKH